MHNLLENIAWHSLSGAHARHAIGTADARRYAPGFATILGFADLVHPNFEGLAPHCLAGEHCYCVGWSGAAPAGWRIEEETTLLKMVWDGAMPDADAAPDALPLAAEHASQALELATLTRPGPFGLRTIELGEYFGCFDGSRLVAMAGERLHAGRLREISGVCTHPDFQGRGFARRLMLKLIRRQLLRDETPCLHVMRANTGAHRLYAQMGFRDQMESVVRVVAPV